MAHSPVPMGTNLSRPESACNVRMVSPRQEALPADIKSTIHKALTPHGRQALIGNGCNSLLGSNPDGFLKATGRLSCSFWCDITIINLTIAKPIRADLRDASAFYRKLTRCERLCNFGSVDPSSCKERSVAHVSLGTDRSQKRHLTV